jgi:transcriptional regulator with XRE-family HTH domain
LEAQEQLAARHIALRERAGLTQEQEARRAGVSPTTISGIESGKITRPHLKTLLKLARALGADVGELRESGKVPAPSSQEKLFNNGVPDKDRRPTDITVRMGAAELSAEGKPLTITVKREQVLRVLHEQGMSAEKADATWRELERMSA